MTGLEYEELVAKYLRRHGYYNVSVTKASGDYGVDVIAHKGTHRYAVQCKYYSDDVGLEAVQEAVAGKAMYRCDKAMVVTNASFTNAACELANKNDVLLLPGISSPGPSNKIIVITSVMISVLIVMACLAGLFAAVGETIIEQFRNHEYKLAIFNVFSILLSVALIAGVIYLIRTVKNRRKEK